MEHPLCRTPGLAALLTASLLVVSVHAQIKPETHKSDCDKEFAAVRAIYDGIPTDFRGLNRERITKIAEDVRVTRDRLEAYLINCSKSGVKPNCEAHHMLARVLTSLAQRQRIEWLQTDKLPADEVNARMKAFHERNVQLCSTTLACLDSGDSTKVLRATVRDLRGDILFQLRRFDEALADYLFVVENAPDFEDIGNTLVGAGRAYLELRRTADGVKFVRNAIKTRYRNSNLPFFYEVLWNLLVTSGDLDGMVEWCREVDKIFPIRMLREKAGKVERDAYQRFLGYSGFRLGYSLFASGDLDGAAAAFRDHIEYLNDLENKLASKNTQLPQELRIYRQRSEDNLRMLQDHIGDAPECDLDLQDLWVTPTRLKLANSTGKAVALLFRGYEDRRSSGFLAKLDKHFCKVEDQGKHAFAALHYLKGSRDPVGQLEKLQDEIVNLGVQCGSVGMDPDPTRKGTFRCLKAMVGSATFMIFDRNGRLAWWQQDPRDMDVDFAAAIWDRLANEEQK